MGITKDLQSANLKMPIGGGEMFKSLRTHNLKTVDKVGNLSRNPPADNHSQECSGGEKLVEGDLSPTQTMETPNEDTVGHASSTLPDTFWWNE